MAAHREPDDGPRVFLSYARKDADKVPGLEEGLRSLGANVWRDRQLVGGHAWWDEILHRIRWCDVFVQAVSPTGIRSKACTLERAYARELGKPVLPVLVDEMSLALLPEDVARLEVLRYIDPSWQDGLRLARAVASSPPAPPLPDPLPPPPDPPPHGEGPAVRPVAVAGYVVLAAALTALAGGGLREATRPADGAEDAAEVLALVFARTIGWALIVAVVSAVIARPVTSGRPSTAALRGLLAGAVSGLAGGLVHGVLQYGADVDSGISRLAGLAVTGALAGAHLGRWLRAPAPGFTGGLAGGLAAGLLVLDWPGPDAPEAVSALSWIAHAVPICAGAVGLAMLLRRRPAPLPEPVAPMSTALKT